MSFWLCIGLIILFNLPKVGFPALLVLSIFGRGSVGKFARGYLIGIIAIIVLIVLAVILGLVNIDSVPDMIPEYKEMEAFLGLPALTL